MTTSVPSISGGPLDPESMLSDLTPTVEGANGSAGVADTAARGDHQHPRFASLGKFTIGSDGTVTITYTRTFSVEPVVFLTPLNTAGSKQLIVEVLSFVIVGGLYTGMVIRGSRAQNLPALTGIVLITNLINALQNFDAFGGSAVGAQFYAGAFLPTV